MIANVENSSKTTVYVESIEDLYVAIIYRNTISPRSLANFSTLLTIYVPALGHILLANRPTVRLSSTTAMAKGYQS